jgi:hypothetical protein
MTDSQAARGNQQYTISGDGVINTGENSQVNNAKGDGNRQSASYAAPSPAGLDPWEQVGKELARIRLLLEGENSHAASADRDDAIEVVITLERDLPSLRESGTDASKRLRQRVKALVGVLTPVAGLIGGVAALQSIWQSL